jgi:hypothetical protein
MTGFSHKNMASTVMCHHVWLLWLKHVTCVKSFVVLWLKCVTFFCLMWHYPYIKEGSLFWFVIMICAKPWCFTLCSWYHWKVLNMQGCISLVWECLELQCGTIFSLKIKLNWQWKLYWNLGCYWCIGKPFSSQI